jgi:carboxyl-terminal processing protease
VLEANGEVVALDELAAVPASVDEEGWRHAASASIGSVHRRSIVSAREYPSSAFFAAFPRPATLQGFSMRKAGVLVAALVPVAVVVWAIVRTPMTPPVAVAPAPSASASASPETDPDDGHDDDRSYVFRIPSGEPTALSCDDARAIIEQVRAGLAYAPESVKPGPFAASAADWLDPHGLLSLSKDAPSAQALNKAAPDLLADIEGKRKRGCASAEAPGAVLEAWSSELRAAFDKGRAAPGATTAASALEAIPVATSAREAAEELGRRAGAFEIAHGSEGKHYADEARRRFFPPLDKDGWAKVVLASAVRAYVPLVDPHGEWAPFDEESRIYEVDLASRPPSRLWGRAILTAIGVKITEAPTPPFAENDLVLSVANVATAGLPLEQVDQLGFASNDPKTTLTAVVLRDGQIKKLQIGKVEDAGAAPHAGADLPVERIAFGDGDAIIIPIKDVRDELGDDLATAISEQREKPGRKLNGVVLDLRGNGGGSTDGALGALSLFLPGAPLFAMKRRDGTVEIDRAAVPHERDRWNGPIATLVDGSTASAAEMIAGALAAYKRGPTIGATTFGKGCAQEYVDDDAHAGVLRMTTLVYALPDGTPVQRVGLVPQIRFPFVAQGDPQTIEERESKLAHSAPAWTGPDVRDPAVLAQKNDEAAWPTNNGNVGPCQEADVCKALRLIGGSKRVPTAKH